MKRILLSLMLLTLGASVAWAQAPVPDAGWAAFVIREASDGNTGAPIIQDNDVYATDAIEFIIVATGQKAGLGTDLINGARIDQISTLHIDRLDDVENSGSLYGPYFNIWVTDGAGQYAVLANEPSDGEWSGSPWDVADWAFLSTKRCKVYETPDVGSSGHPGTSWVADYALNHGWDGVEDLRFEHVAGLVISPPSAAYILDGNNNVGSGAPDELGTNVARGYNWIFGDTLANYVTGEDGFIVDNYSATADWPVENTTQATFYGSIQAALDEAVDGDAIVVAAGHYEEQLHVTVDNVSVTGAGIGATVIESPVTLALSFTTSAANYPVVFVDHAEGVAFADLTLDGLRRADTNYRFQGFGYYNSGGSLTNIEVLNIVNAVFSGAQHGVGVYCYADDAAAHEFDMTDVLVEEFQKGAVAVAGAGVTGDLLRVSTPGAGPTDVTAQNGIQIGYGAVVNVTDCDVSGIDYTGDSWSASGLLCLEGGIAYFDGCSVDGCQTSVYFSNGGGSFDNGTVTNPTGDAMYAYSSGAKVDGKSDRPLVSAFAEDGLAATKAAIAVSIDNSVFTGAGIADSWGPSTWGYGPVTLTITNSTITNWDWGTVMYDYGGMVLSAQGSGNTIAGNLTAGAWANTTDPYDLRDNDWGDASGPLHTSRNPNGLGNEVAGNVLFTPWEGRVATTVADLGATPNGAYYWEGATAIGVDDDSAPGFAPGAFQAPGDYTRYGWDPAMLFGRDITVGELYQISYFTKKGTLHTVDAADWYLIMYTDPYDGSPGSSWYGNRINSEPYFSADLVETAGEWTLFQSLAGQNNRLRYFDSSDNYYGAYTDGFLLDMATDDAYSAQPIMLMGLTLGTAWAAGFDGLLDGMTIELVSGETVTMNFLSGNAQAAATPAVSGPISCSGYQDVTFSVALTEDMPDLFLYNAVIEATEEVTFGDITDLLPFTDDSELFQKYQSGTNQWTITGSTVGNPSYPVSGPAIADLFKIRFHGVADGDAAISFQSLVLRDPDNNTIPVVVQGATIAVDCTAPDPVTGITAAPGHNKVDVSWTHDGTDVDHYVVFSGLWHDGTPGVSAYPEYDDYAGDVIPTPPADYDAAVDADPIWLPLTAVYTTDQTQSWGDSNHRGVYYYTVFAIDAAGNASAAPAALDRATNYWLGDVDQAPGDAGPDGEVDAFDINQLGAYFGETIATDALGSDLDVGPTDDWSRLGIPTTDSIINFEDLMIFALNFGVVGDAKSQVPAGDSVDLAWVAYDDGTMALRLNDGACLKGLRVVADAPVGSVIAGDLLDAQSELTFLKNVGQKLDASVAVMGVNNTFTGAGDLLVVSAESAISVDDLVITARGADNRELEIKLSETADTPLPRVFALQENYPNPFNPQTKIAFSLPEAQHVRLTIYGVDGRVIKTLVDENRGAGLHEIVWQGRDRTGRSVASGTYFYRIEAGPYSDVKKMTLMK